MKPYKKREWGKKAGHIHTHIQRERETERQRETEILEGCGV